MSYSHVRMKSCSRHIQISYPLVFMLRFACSVVNIDELWLPSASHYLGSLDLSLACSWTLSLALCSFAICLSRSVISCHCGNGLMASGSFEIVLLCSCALFRPYDLDILLAWHHARMLSCFHTRGVIMLLHFPAPTASCPHAPNRLQSLTCKETLPHGLAWWAS